MLLEREAEHAAVAAALRGCHTGNGSLLVVTGPLGIGRTALLQSLPALVEPEQGDAQEDRVRVLRASGALLEQDFPFGVVRQLFEPVMSGVPPETRQRWLAGSAALAGPVFAYESFTDETTLAPAVAQTLLHGLHALAANLSVERPLLVLVDDLQWVDAPSLRWLGYLARRLDGLAATVVVTVREGDLASEQAAVREITGSAAVTLRLWPLSIAGVRALVHAEFDEPGDELFVEACHDATGGLPLFVTGALAGLALEGRRPVAAEAGAVRTPNPEPLRDRLVACLRSLPRPIREFAEAMGVLGDEADHDMIGALAGLDSVGCTEALRVLGQLGLLDDDAVCRFRYPAVLDAVEHSMSVAERERVHLDAATLLHTRGRPVEQVAAHLLAVTAQEDSWATDVLRAAADVALRRGASDVAARYLRRALLDCSPGGGDRAGLLVDLATVERGFDLAASVRHIIQAVPLLTSVRGRAAAVVRITPTVLDMAPSRIGELVRQVAVELGEPDTLDGAERELALRLEARLRYARQSDEGGFASVADRLRGLGAEPELATGAQRELVAVLLHTAMVGEQLPAAEVARLGNRVLEREPATPAHVHTALPLLIPTLLAADSVQKAASWLDVALDQAREQDAVVAHVSVCTEQSLVLLGLGDLQGARARAFEARDLAMAEWPDGAPMTFAALISVALETKDLALSDWLIDRREQRLANAFGRLYQQAGMLLLRGSVLAARDDPRGALDYVLDCGQLLDQAGWRNPALHPWRSWAAHLYQLLDDLDAARQLAAEEYAHAVAWGAPGVVGGALRLRGSVTGGEEGIELLREAVTTLAASDNRLLRARALVQLGRKLRAEGADDAEEPLRQGHQLAAECGVAWLVESARAELAALGWSAGRQARPAEASAQSARPTLTKTERLVARMAATGRTNQEIAEHLSVSSRAVEKHLTNAYRKLAVPGRSGLADALRSDPDGTDPPDADLRAS